MNFLLKFLFYISNDCSRMSPAVDEQKVSKGFKRFHYNDFQSAAKRNSINQSGSGAMTGFFRLSALSISGYSDRTG